VPKLAEHKWLLPALLILLGLLTRFLFIWLPAEVVFDEVHFGKFVNAYFTGEYYFDIHPPLGKLLLALGGWLGGYQGNFDFDRIGEPYGHAPYIALRILPNLAGALIPFAAYLLFTALGISWRVAWYAGMLLVFENAFLVQSHFILLDAFLLLFGLLGAAFFFRARSWQYALRELALAGFFLSLSVSVKWTGLAFFALAGFFVLKDFLVPFLRSGTRALGAVLPRFIVTLVFLPLLTYVLIFFIHFSLLSKSGPGDAFMSPQFRAGEKNILEKTLELNRTMYRANATLSATHPYSSKYHTWPFMTRPVYYWVKSYEGNGTARIYFLGNAPMWWLSTFGLFAAFFFWRAKQKELKAGLFAGYLLNMLPFMVVPRVLFLYHYLAALVFAIGIVVVWLDALAKGRKYERYALPVLLFIAIIGFVFFAPLSYGLPLADAAYRMRVWLGSWM